jgi:hypothetical protein
MRLIKISFKSVCPTCNHSNEVPIGCFNYACENCDTKWNPSKPKEDPRPLRDSPTPKGPDRRV